MGSGAALAEGSGQLGKGQRLRDYPFTRDAIYVDIIEAGEWIAMSACGEGNTDIVRYTMLYHPPGADVTTSVGALVDLDTRVGEPDYIERTGANAGFECSSGGGGAAARDRRTNIPTFITNPVRHQTDKAGIYEVRLDNRGVDSTDDGDLLRRFDVTVMKDGTTDPSPFAANGERGRVWARRWAMLAYSFGVDDATDANFFILTPGGLPGTNYVWELDFNNMAGFGYNVIANGIGVDEPSSAYSVPQNPPGPGPNNTVSARYPLYLHDPVIAQAPPAVTPDVRNFQFRDANGNDIAINPTTGNAGETEGTFSFITNIPDATYAIAIDTGGANRTAANPNGEPNQVYGDVGDAILNGYVSDGTDNGDGTYTVATVWDGTDAKGQPLPAGNYTARVMVRMGEFHFVASDVETSGGIGVAGAEDGLTIFEITQSGTRQSTKVYWDDETWLEASQNAATGAPSGSYLGFTTPGGQDSGTTEGYHTWGRFQEEWADRTFIDTFVYGRAKATTTPAQITTDPTGGESGFATGYVQIDATTVGGTVDLLIGDGDLDGDPGVTGRVTNPRGAFVDVTLTPDPNNAGVFLATIPTRVDDGTTGGALPVLPGDELTLSYIDANTGTGAQNVTITDTDVVGGSDGVPDVTTGIVGEPILLSVTDADITGTRDLVVEVFNERTGENETVTLTRPNLNSGAFTLSLPSTGTATDPASNGSPASDDDNGLMLVASGDVVRIDYVDALRENGGAGLTVSDVDNVKSGTPASVAIQALTVGEDILVTVTDGDRAGLGTVEADLRNTVTGESGRITLTERVNRPGLPDQPGVFDAAVPTSYRTPTGTSGAAGTFGARDDGAPGATDSGDTFEVTYTDVAPVNGPPIDVTASDPIDGGANGAAEIVAELYAVGQALELTVTDTDLVGEPFVSVVVERRAQNGTAIIERQFVLLTPTGTPGEFSRTLPTAFGTGADGVTAWNDTNPGANSINARATDVMTLRYADAVTGTGEALDRIDPATMTGGTDGQVAILALDANGNPLPANTPVTVGESVRITVTDPDPDDTGALPNFVDVTVTTAQNENETVRLNRVGTTDTYAADVPTAYATAAPVTGDGTLDVRDGQTLSVTYEDGFDVDGSPTDHAPVKTLGTVGGATAEPAIVATSVGAPLDLTLTDADLDGQASVTVTVSRLNAAGTVLETEIVVLDAAAGPPGTFARPADGSNGTPIATRFDAGNDASDTNGTMNAISSDRFEISMTDALLDDGGTGRVAAEDAIGGGANGTATIVAATYPVGGALELLVTDTDLDQLPFIDVLVERRPQGAAPTSAPTETQTVRLAPATGTNPATNAPYPAGSFTATLPTAFGTGADGTTTWDAGNPAANSINAIATDVMTLVYDDALTSTGNAVERTDIAGMTGGFTGTIALAGEQPGGAVRAGDELTVTVRDDDRPGTDPGDGRLTFTVTIENGRETETVTVRETAPGTGIYEGVLPTTFGTVDDGTPGTMAVNATDTITATYADAFTATGGTRSTKAVRKPQGGADGRPTIVATVPGEPLDLKVTDTDLTGTSITVEVVRIVGSNVVDSRQIVLPATGGGTFVLPATGPGAVTTSYDATPGGTGATTGNAFLARAGDTFEIVYTDELRQDGSTGDESAVDTMDGGTPGVISITAGLPGAPLTVGLDDADRPGTDPGDGRRVVDVTLTNTSQGAPQDVETVSLRETAAGTGIYEGTLPTTFGASAGAGAAGDAGTMVVQAGDVIEAAYADALIANGGPGADSAAATVAGGATGRVTIAATLPGNDATLTLIDTDRPGTDRGDGRRTIDLVVTGPGGETETVTMTETAAMDGNYEGAIPTVYDPDPLAARVSGDGSFPVRNGDVLRVDYADALDDDGATTSTADDTATIGGGNDGKVSISATTPGQPATVTVTDLDLAGGPIFTLTVVGPQGETETVTMSETGTPGTFEGTVQTVYDTNPGTAGTNNDGTFAVRRGDVLEAFYDDALTAAGGQATETNDATITGGKNGSVTISATTPGRPATVTVIDTDLAGGPDFTVTVTGPQGETETVTVSETGTPGTFEGTVQTVFDTAPGTAGTNDDGTFAVIDDDVLTASYDDALTLSGGTATVTNDATIGGGADGTVTISATTPGEAATVTVIDTDLAGGPDFTVTVTGPGGETETVTVSETGTPGTFEGTLPTTFDPVPNNGGTPNDGTIAVHEGDVLTAAYDDALTDAGGTATVTNDATIGGGSSGTVTIVATLPGEDATVTLIDADLKGTNPGPLTVTMADGQSATVVMTEELDAAGDPTGRFTGTVPTIFDGSAGPTPAGGLRIERDDVLTVVYDDALTDEGGTASVDDTATIQGGADGTVTIVATSPGADADVTIVDADLIGAVPFDAIVSGPGNENETVRMTEVPGTPGTFTGRVATTYDPDPSAPRQSGDGTFPVRTGTVLAATYGDALTAAGGTATRTDDATIGGGATGTIAITATVPGEDATVTLIDADLTGTNPGPLTVTMTDGQSATVTLTEELDGAGNPTGRFTGTVPTVFDDPANATPTNGLRVERDDVLRVTYDDALTDTGGTASPGDTATIRGGETGTITIMATVPGEPVTVTLVDGDLAGAPAGTVTIDVTGPNGQVVTVTLTEDPANPGTFTADVPTAFADGTTPPAGTLALASGDTVGTTYADALTLDGGTGTATDTATLGGGTAAVVAIDATTVGEPVALTLTDPDLAGDPTAQVAVRNVTTGETEWVTLTAVAGQPGTFEGTAATVFGTTPGASTTDGTFPAQAGDVIRIWYMDPLGPDGGPVAVTATDPIAGGVTGTPAVGAPTVGGPVALGVTDPDIAGAGSIAVTVVNDRTGETETVTLVEDPANPGTFTAQLPTAFGTTPGTNGDGTMTAQAGDPLTLTYADGLRADGSAGPVPATAIIGGGTTGVVSLDPAPVGQPMPVTLVDPDLAGQSAVTVTVTNPDTGGTETITLTVDPNDPTRFVGAVPTVFGTVDDGDPLNGALPVAAGTVLTVAYDDGLNDVGAPETVAVTAAPTGGTDAVATLGPATVGGPLPIALTDPDMAGLGPITVTITNQDTGEVETVVLTEDPGNPGTFIGQLPTTYGDQPGTNGDGTMTATGGAGLTLAYADPFGADGGPVALDVPVTLGSGVTATIAVVPTPIGTPTPITVVDPGTPGPITVTVTTPDGTPVQVTLVEDPANPGTFTGSVPTAPPGATATPGTLIIEPGAPIVVTYGDPVSATGAPVTVRTAVATPNAVPVATNDTAATAPEVAVSIPALVNDADPEGRPLRIVEVAGPNGGPVTGGDVTFGTDGTVLFTPLPGTTGLVMLTYTVADPAGLRATATITITVDANAPTAVADTASTPTDTPVIVPVLTNDRGPNGTVPEIVSLTDVVGGTATILADGTVEFVPTPGFTGEAGFTYTVRGPTGLTDTARATVTVEADPVVLTGDVATTPNDTPVAVPLLANDDPGAHGPLTVTRVTQGGNGTVTLDPVTGIATYDPDPDFSGTDTFTYEVCDARGRCETATVTVTVEPPLASIAGLVWRDLDHDGALAIDEPLLPGWTVEIERGGQVLASATTDAAGAYRVDNLVPGSGYRVVFRSPTGIVWDAIDDVTLDPGLTTADQSLPVDPSGVVYDAATRDPIENAVLTITDASGVALPGRCLVDPSQQGQSTGADGFYRFDVVPGADALCPAAETVYRLALVKPDGTAGTSSAIPAEGGAFDPTNARRTPGGKVEIVPSDDAPRGTEATTYYLAFAIAPGDPDTVNNHLPIDLAPRPAILVTKTALARTVRTGSAIPYRITVQNADAAPRTGITLVDMLPAGFAYRDGSSTVDGVRVDARVRGRRVEYRGLTLPANGQVTIGLVAVAGSAVREGDHVNRAFAVDGAGLVVSNVGTATVEHAPDPDFDCSTVIGRVFVDGNGNGRLDDGEAGLPGVRLATVEGLLVTTGRLGRYHLPCAMVPNAAIGSSFVVKVDERTVPLGYRLVSRNPVLTRLTRGTMTKVNFAVQQLAEVRLDFSAAAFHPHTTRLLPDYVSALDGLVDRLAGTPSRLTLVYHAEPGESGGTERMRGVAGDVERLWKGRGRPYRLDIERTVLRDAVPTGLRTGYGDGHGNGHSRGTAAGGHRVTKG